MKKIAACIASCGVLFGCNGIPTPFVHDPIYSQFFVVHSGPPLPLLVQGSAIQWNEEYAVTAKHIPFLWNVAYEGQSDVAFFKHKAKTVPVWRQAKAGESLTAVGFSPFLIPVKSTGHALSSRIRLSSQKDGVLYSMSDFSVVSGMSGGPVFADDNSVVGITISFSPKSYFKEYVTPEIVNSERISAFLSYKEIKKEWEAYQGTLKAPSTPEPVEIQN